MIFIHTVFNLGEFMKKLALHVPFKAPLDYRANLWLSCGNWVVNSRMEMSKFTFNVTCMAVD